MHVHVARGQSDHVFDAVTLVLGRSGRSAGISVLLAQRNSKSTFYPLVYSRLSVGLTFR